MVIGHSAFCRSIPPICVHLFSGKIVTAVVVKHYRAILRNTVLPGSLEATVVHELKSHSMGMSLVHLPASSALRPGAGLGDSLRAGGGSSAHHLLAPLALAGLLQSTASCLNWQRARGEGSQQAAAAVHGESQVHR